MTTPPPPESTPNYGGEPSSDDRTMALLCHFGMIFFGWVPGLIIYLIKGDSPWAKKEAAKTFNFAITVQIGYIALFIVGFIFAIMDIALLSCLISIGYLALWVTMAAFGIINGMKVNNNEETRYPFEIPILK